MVLKDKTIIICSIVRDSAKGLRKNIPIIKSFASLFKEYKVVVYENDSKDKTKLILKKWSEDDEGHVFALMEDWNAGYTIPSSKDVSCNPFFSRKRISKMVDLRNQYLNYIESKGWNTDYLMVVDLDVACLDFEGILSSFRKGIDWDAVTAFGYSMSPKLRRRYHDTYALTEVGDEGPQTENKILFLADKYGKLKADDNWIRVFSAFGGLAIYRFEAIQGLRYRVIKNNDKRVEVKCEHFSIYQQMKEKGYDRVYINPAMVVKYQALSWSIIFNSVARKLRFK